jgi:hypothetical protein
VTETGSLPAAGQFVDSQMEVPNRVEFRRNNVRGIFNSGDSPLYLEQIITPGSNAPSPPVSHRGCVAWCLFPSRPLWTYVMKSTLRGDISEFVTLAIIMLIVPASSAQAERLFSCMNFIKSDHRNRLGDPEEHLNHTIRLFTSEYELDNFHYDTALEIFLAKKIEGV